MNFPDRVDIVAPLSEADVDDTPARLLPPALGALLLHAQTLQLMQIEGWLAWQHGVLAALRELHDQWAARFGGGLPIDA